MYAKIPTVLYNRPSQYACAGGQLSHGLRHLSALRAAGLTHIHLLPIYDFGSVPERKEDQAVLEASGACVDVWKDMYVLKEYSMVA